MKELHFGLYKFLPKSVIKLLDPIYYSFFKPIKFDREYQFWQKKYIEENKNFNNSHYEKLMLGIAQEKDQYFLKDKIIADFGCGPRGSLKWVNSAKIKIGIDVLVEKYTDNFTSNIISHDMVYVQSTENVIPIPSNYIDILFTLNAMDHVDNFDIMSKEIIRIIKPNGEFIASFNLNEPVTECEPLTLTEDIIKKHLLNYFSIISYRVTNALPNSNSYEQFFKGNLNYNKGEIATLWVRAIKK